MVGTMDLVFLGTGSCYPSPSRGASSTVLRMDGECWMFDCGEGIQIQYQRSSVKPGRLTRIFITHLHGDHLFGLPGLMCLIQGAATVSVETASPEPVHLYGPVGLRNYIRTSLVLSGTYFVRPYIVHEIDVEGTGKDDELKTPNHPNEMEGEIIRQKDGSFFLFETKEYKVEAGALKHPVPCIGFVVTEANTVGSLDVNLLKSKGIPPGPLYGKIKSGQTVTAPSGELITPDMVLGEDKPGRKIVILGDTCDNTDIEGVASGADVIVHEATHQDELVEKALQFGHSTPSMAAEFSLKMGARTLVLTHFSQRYKDDPEDCKVDGEVCTQYLAEQATRDGLTVIPARDLMSYTIPR